jgi:hypothetical protein
VVANVSGGTSRASAAAAAAARDPRSTAGTTSWTSPSCTARSDGQVCTPITSLARRPPRDSEHLQRDARERHADPDLGHPDPPGGLGHQHDVGTGREHAPARDPFCAG